MDKHIFISYSREDINLRDMIRERLVSSNIPVWTDDSLTPGTPNWQMAIEGALEISIALVVILSPEAKQSRWVRAEITDAENREIPIFPLLAKGDELTSVPLGLNLTQWIDVRVGFDEGIDKLIFTLLNEVILSDVDAEDQTKAFMSLIGEDQTSGQIYVETQFETYKNMWADLLKLRRAGDDLWGEVNEENLIEFSKLLEETRIAAANGELFLEEDDSGMLHDVLREFRQYMFGKKLLHERYLSDDDVEEIKRNIQENRRAKDDYEMVLAKILASYREKLKSM